MWSEDNPNSDLPAFYYADQLAKKNITRSNNASASRHNNSSRLYEKADYLALRELTLSWDLPKHGLAKHLYKTHLLCHRTKSVLCHRIYRHFSRACLDK